MIKKLLFAALVALYVMPCMAERMLRYSYNESKYQSNMTVVAKVQQDGVFLTDCEVAVFDSNGECRYSGASTTDLNFLAIQGDGSSEVMTFRIVYGPETAPQEAECNETLTFAADAIVGLDDPLILTMKEAPLASLDNEEVELTGDAETGYMVDELTINDGESFASSVDFTVGKLTFNRTFVNDGGRYTFMVPFAVTNAADYGTFYAYTSWDSATGTVVLTAAESVEANTPYVFVPVADVTSILLENVVVKATDALTTAKEGLVGVYSTVTVPSGCYGYSAGDIKGYSAGAFVKAGDGVTMPPYRAFLTVGEATEANVLRTRFEDGTGLTTIVTMPTDGTIYNLMGQRVEHTQQGNIYIVNGTKKQF